MDQSDLYKWKLMKPDPNAIRLLQRDLGCSRLLATLLVNRNISDSTNAFAYLNPSYAHLADPFLLPDAEAAVRRINSAIRRGELIGIHGDYDSDGVTSAALWARLLHKMDANTTVYVPHREKDGYDLRSKFVDKAITNGVKLIITADCGIQRFDEVIQAKEAGIDVIVTDHHLPSDTLPDAVAVVNPMRKDSKYPFMHLAGVGVVYRLGEALVKFMGKSIDSYRRAYADLVAIGTITDIMPLLGENRVFVKYGLQQIQASKKPGIRALLETSGIGNIPITTHHVGFQIGPRINAVGRMDDANIALSLLTTHETSIAVELAEMLEQANNNRKEEERKILQEALTQVGKNEDDDLFCMVLAGENWHPGVVGLVANKIVDMCNRPSILVSIDMETGLAKGSARSIKAFNIFDAILECNKRLGRDGQTLMEFGGHSHAAGLTLHSRHLREFSEMMDRIAKERLKSEDFIPILQVDAVVNLAKMTPEVIQEISMTSPWGHANEEPIFASLGLRVERTEKFGKEMNHAKFLFSTPEGDKVEGIMWRANRLPQIPTPDSEVSICYKPEINSYSNHIRLNLLDIHPSKKGCRHNGLAI